MLKNYLKIAFRTIFKHKLFSFINIFGLAASLSFCLLVIVIIQDQNSFDTFHPRGDDVYRVLTNAHRKSGGVERYASTPHPLGDVLTSQSPAVETLVRLVRGLSGDAKSGEVTLRVSGFFVDPAFFDLFGFELAQGNPEQALRQPNSIVLSAETAAKFFGDEEAMGRTLSISGLQDFVVTGVMKPQAGKSHIEFDALGSSSILPVLEPNRQFPLLNSWNNYYSSYNYLRLKPGLDANAVQTVLDAIPDQHYSDLELESRDAGYSFELQALNSITPGPMMSNNLGSAMPDTILIFLSVLAGLGILGAVFNYTNLTLARSFTRAKEIGIRKVSGAARRQLLTQFLMESTLVVLVALAGAALLLHFLLIPGFGQLQMATELNVSLHVGLETWVTFAGFAMLVGVMAGLLPAVVISRFKPVQVLKDVSKLNVLSNVSLRKILIVFQFALSLVLLILVTIVYQQINYALKMDYGFKWEHSLFVNLQGVSPGIAVQELSRHSEVTAHTVISHNMGTWEDSSVDVRLDRSGEPMGVRDYSVDAGFVDYFELSLVAGKSFTERDSAFNRSQVLVNEKFLERFRLGTPHEAIGRQLVLGDSTDVRISGVVQNFQYKPVVYELEPVLFRFTPENWRVLYMKVHGANTAAFLDKLETSWAAIDPVHPVDVQFYDAKLREVYSTFADMISIVGFLAVLATVISLLGLLGIATFNAESRTKEIGIRKVLGATFHNLLFVLTRSDMLMVGIAAVIAVPVSLFLGGQILQTFAYRIDLGPAVVLPALLGVLLLGAAIVGWQAARAALANPIGALRSE